MNKMKQLLTSILWIGVLSAQNTVVQQFSKAFADVAESARPAVVTIITDKVISLEQYENFGFFFWGCCINFYTYTSFLR